MTDINPLDSPVLHKQFPGLSGAFDAEAAPTYLANALLCRNSGRYTISECYLDESIYVPGDCCILRFRIRIEDQNSGRTAGAIISGRLFPNALTCNSYVRDRLVPLVRLAAGREELVPFVRPVALVEPLHMAVCVFPLDGELPALIPATDSKQVAAFLNETPVNVRSARSPIEVCRVDLVVYRRQHRAVVRYVLDPPHTGTLPAGDSILYGKLVADNGGALAARIGSALLQHVAQIPSAFRFNIPEVVAWRPDQNLTLLRSVPGESGMIHRALKLRLRGRPESEDSLSLEEMVQKAAVIAAAIHTSGIGIGPARSLDNELLELRGQIAEVQSVSPQLGLRLGGWLEQLASVAGSPAQESRLCHGDFTSGQILFDGGDSSLVDFDSACQSEPALDIGQFLAYLRMACMKGAGATTAEATSLADQLSKTFIAAYSDSVRPSSPARQLAERSAPYRRVSLLRRAIHSWQKFKPQRVEAAIIALQEEISLLPTGRTRVRGLAE